MKLPYARRAAAPKNSPEPLRWRDGAPSVTLLVLILLSVLPTGMVAHLHVVPLLAIMGVYFWSIYRPEALPASLLFAFGFINDLVTGEPLLGLSALLFLAVWWGVSRQNNFFRAQNFITLWLGFAVIAALAILLQNLFSYTLLSSFISFRAALMAELINVALYPPVTALLYILWRALIRWGERSFGFTPPPGTR